MSLKINLNTFIKVKLTEYGKDIYFHRVDEVNAYARKIVCKPELPKVDENGYTDFPLWEFMYLYGKHMGMAMPNVIEPLEIIISGDREVYEVGNRLDKTISDLDYIVGSLMSLRNIYETHNCNECGKKDCEYRPDWGRMVRYNCPHYEEKK